MRRVASGPLLVPTSTGYYVCSFAMEVNYVAGGDVVLGRDWMDAVGVGHVGPYIPDPVGPGVALLPRGFAWEPLPRSAYFTSYYIRS